MSNNQIDNPKLEKRKEKSKVIQGTKSLLGEPFQGKQKIVKTEGQMSQRLKDIRLKWAKEKILSKNLTHFVEWFGGKDEQRHKEESDRIEAEDST